MTALKDDVKAQSVESVVGLNMNEFLMYHGAPAEKIDRLELQGLDPRYAGEHAGKLFGAGVYLATNASKSDIYTSSNDAGERCVLLVRVCQGEPQFTKEAMTSARKPAKRPDGRGVCNSVAALTHAQGGVVEHPEYVVFNAWQTLPEYAIWCSALPPCYNSIMRTIFRCHVSGTSIPLGTAASAHIVCCSPSL